MTDEEKEQIIAEAIAREIKAECQAEVVKGWHPHIHSSLAELTYRQLSILHVLSRVSDLQKEARKNQWNGLEITLPIDFFGGGWSHGLDDQVSVLELAQLVTTLESRLHQVCEEASDMRQRLFLDLPPVPDVIKSEEPWHLETFDGDS